MVFCVSNIIGMRQTLVGKAQLCYLLLNVMYEWVHVYNATYLGLLI